MSNPLFALSTILAVATAAMIATTGTIQQENWQNLTTGFDETETLLQQELEAYNNTTRNLTLDRLADNMSIVNIPENGSLEDYEYLPLNSSQEEIEEFMNRPGKKVMVPTTNQSELDEMMQDPEFQQWVEEQTGVNTTQTYTDPETNQTYVGLPQQNSSEFFNQSGGENSTIAQLFSPDSPLGQLLGNESSPAALALGSLIASNPELMQEVQKQMQQQGIGGQSGTPGQGLGQLPGTGNIPGMDLPGVSAPNAPPVNLPSNVPGTGGLNQNLGNMFNIPDLGQFLTLLLPLLFLPFLYIIIKYVLMRHILKKGSKTKHVKEVEAAGTGVGATYEGKQGKGVQIIDLHPLFQIAVTDNLVQNGRDNEIELDIRNTAEIAVEDVSVEIGGVAEKIGLIGSKDHVTKQIPVGIKVTEKTKKLEAKIKLKKVKYQGKKCKEFKFKIPVERKRLTEQEAEKKTPQSPEKQKQELLAQEATKNMCYKHPDREGVAKCVRCNKVVCKECAEELHERIYCHDCLKAMLSENL